MSSRGNWFICSFRFVHFRSGPKVIDSSREQMRNHHSLTRAVVTQPKGRRVLTKNGYLADRRKKVRLHGLTCILHRDSVVNFTFLCCGIPFSHQSPRASSQRRDAWARLFESCVTLTQDQKLTESFKIFLVFKCFFHSFFVQFEIVPTGKPLPKSYQTEAN